MAQRALIQNRVIGVLAAIQAGTGAWYFQHERWTSGILDFAVVAFLALVYVLAQRRKRKSHGGRRY